MPASTQFKETKSNSGEKAVEGYCAVWHGAGVWDVFIGAPSLDGLRSMWTRITGLKLREEDAQRVRITKME